MGNLKPIERKVNALFRYKFLDTLLLGFYVNYIEYNPDCTDLDAVQAFMVRMKLEDDDWLESSSKVVLNRMKYILEDEFPHLR